MPKYTVPSFQIETIEEFNESYDGQMQEARLTNGWDIRIPADVSLEQAWEPPAPLKEGIYAIEGVQQVHWRSLSYADDKPTWLMWTGDKWEGSPHIYYRNEDDELMRSRLHYIGVANGSA